MMESRIKFILDDTYEGVSEHAKLIPQIKMVLTEYKEHMLDIECYGKEQIYFGGVYGCTSLNRFPRYDKRGDMLKCMIADGIVTAEENAVMYEFGGLYGYTSTIAEVKASALLYAQRVRELAELRHILGALKKGEIAPKFVYAGDRIVPGPIFGNASVTPSYFSIEELPVQVSQGGMLVRNETAFRSNMELLVGGMPRPRRGKGRNRRGKKNGGNASIGNDNRPPRVLGSQQIQTQIRIKDKQVRRAFTGIVSLTSSASSTLLCDVASNSVNYDCAIGSGTTAAGADTINFAANYEMFKIKRVEVIWNPIVAPTTAIPPLYVAYDAELTDADLNSAVSLATVSGYNNHVRFDPRMGTSFTFRNKPPASTALAANVLMGGWQPTSVIGTFATSTAFVGPGVITIQGTGLGASVLLGRIEVTYDVAFKGAR